MLFVVGFDLREIFVGSVGGGGFVIEIRVVKGRYDCVFVVLLYRCIEGDKCERK